MDSQQARTQIKDTQWAFYMTKLIQMFGINIKEMPYFDLNTVGRMQIFEQASVKKIGY